LVLLLLVVMTTHTSSHASSHTKSTHVKPSTHTSPTREASHVHAHALAPNHPTTHATITTEEDVEPAGQVSGHL
jgi:hypothetical protein